MVLSHEIHPAQNLKDNVYPIGEHLNKEKRHSIYYQRAIYSFNTLALGGVVNLQLNNNEFMGDMMLEMKIDCDPTGSTLRPLPGVRLIDRVEVIVGGSSQYIVNGDDIFNFMYDQAESNSKRAALIEGLGGNGGSKTSAQVVYYPLGHLPWSKIGVCEKLPFDSTLCGQVKMYLYLRDSSAIYSAGVTKTSLLSGKLYVRSATIQEPQDKLVLAQNQAISYPFTYIQSFVSPVFTPASVTTTQSVYLTGFKNAPVTQIFLRCILQSNTPNDSQNLVAIKNVVVSLNGNILFKEDEESFKYLQLFQNKAATSWNYDGSNDRYYASLVFSQYPSKVKDFNLEHQHGLQLTNQQVLVQFEANTTSACVLQATYCYNANLVIANNNAEFVI